MSTDELSEAEAAVVDLLRKGRCTTGYLVDETGYSRAHINTQLRILLGKRIIHKFHKDTALYELADDPMPSEDVASDEPETILRRLSKELAEPIVVGDRVYEDGDAHVLSESEENHTEEEK